MYSLYCCSKPVTLLQRVQNDQFEDCADHEITRLTEVFKLQKRRQ